eukprot:TCONS_00021835-protein
MLGDEDETSSLQEEEMLRGGGDLDTHSDLDRNSTNLLLRAKQFSTDSMASYGSINSAHYDNIKPGLKPGVSFDSISDNKIANIKKMFFGRRVDSLTEPGEFEDDHLITRQDKANCTLILFALKHSMKIFLVTSPTILIACCFVIGLSYIPWTDVPSCNNNATQPCTHYRKEYLVYFNTYLRLILLSTTSVFITNIALDGSRQIFKNILYVSIPLVTIATALIPGLLKYNDVILYYYVDIFLCGLFFLVGMVASVFCLSKNLEVQITRKRIFQVLVIPSIIAVLGVNVLDAVVNKEYQIFSKGSIGQYVVRLVIYPITVDILLAITETNVQKIPSNHINNPSHVVYFYQVAFTIIGRYMTTISGGIMDIFIMAASVAGKDFILHRMGRIRCWLAFHTRTLLVKFYPPYANTVDYETFKDWFYSKDFTYFKANTLNSDFAVELTGVIIVPAILATSNKHSSLYSFQDKSFLNSDGTHNYIYILQQEAIQISLVFISIIIVTYIEAKFNRVNLTAVVKRKSYAQYISETLIYLWGILLFLSSVKTTPNYLQCDDMTVCNCDWQIDATKYGC